MFITLDDVSCLMHLPIKRKILNNWKINIDYALEMMVDYLGVDPEVPTKEFEATRGAHAKFQFLKNNCIDELVRAEKAIDDDKQVAQHINICYESIPVVFIWHYHFYGKECHLYEYHLPVILQ